MSFTPATLLAAKGLIKGLAFDRSYLDSVLLPYSSIECVMAAQSAINSTPSPGVLGAATFPAFTGVIDNANSDLVAAIINRADFLLPPGDSKTLYQLILASKAYVDSVSSYTNSIDTLSNKQLSEMAINGSTFTDSIDMGLSKLVDDPARLPDLGAAIGRIGSLYDFTRIDTLGTARNVASSIIARYYPTRMKEFFAANGVDLDDIHAEENEDAALRTLAKLSGHHLSEIQIAFDATFLPTIETMADVIDIEKMMADVIDTVQFSTIAELFAAFRFFPQTASLGSAKSIQTLLESITVISLDNISDPDLSLPDVTTHFGSNATNDGPPTLMDLMGTVVAATYEDQIPVLVDALNEVQATSLGQATIQLMNDITADPTAGTVPATVALIESNLLAMASTPKGIEATAAYNEILDQLEREIQNTSIAHLDQVIVDSGLASPTAGLQFAQSLVNMAEDSDIARILTLLAANNTYGDAVKATLTEGKNMAALRSAGLNPPNIA